VHLLRFNRKLSIKNSKRHKEAKMRQCGKKAMYGYAREYEDMSTLGMARPSGWVLNCAFWR